MVWNIAGKIYRAAVTTVALFTASAAQLRSENIGSPLPSTTSLIGLPFFASTMPTDLGDATMGDVATDDPEADSSAGSSLVDLQDVSHVIDVGRREIILQPRGARAAKLGSRKRCGGGDMDIG